MLRAMLRYACETSSGAHARVQKRTFARAALASVLACLLAVSALTSALPHAAFAAFPSGGTLTLAPSEVNMNTKSVSVTATGCEAYATGGSASIVLGTVGAQENVTSWIDFENIQQLSRQDFTGNKTYNFDLSSTKLQAGRKLVAYLTWMDADFNQAGTFSTPTMIKWAETPTEPSEPTKPTPDPTPEEILKECAVTLAPVNGTEFKEGDTQAKVTVKLHSSLTSVVLNVYAYPSDATFESDVASSKMLFSGTSVTNGQTLTVNFTNTHNLPLKVGQSVIASLNVPVGKDTSNDLYYRQSLSAPVRVVDKNGQGFTPYTWPDATLKGSNPQAGDNTLRLSLTGDKRLFDYAADASVDFSMTVSVRMYPANEAFDFEGENQIPLYFNQRVTAPITDKVITLNQPLKAGYKVRAVVYWTQNNDLFIPKGNDYEEKFKLADDSLTVAGEVAPTDPKETASVTLNPISSDSLSVVAKLMGTIPAGSTLLLKSYDAVTTSFASNSGTFVASKLDATATTYTLTPASASIAAGKKVVAFVLSSGNVVATSTPVVVRDATQPAGKDGIVVTPAAVTTDTTSISVTVSGYDKYKGGRLIVGQAISARDADGARQLASTTYASQGTYSFNWAAGELTEGRHLVVYLYKYDTTNESTSYDFADDIVISKGSSTSVDPNPTDPQNPDPKDPNPQEPVAQKPTVWLTDAKITAGMTHAKLSYKFDNTKQSAKVTIYQFEGETLNTATATVINESMALYSSKTNDTIGLGYGKIKARSKLQAVIRVGTEEARSNVIVVQPSPNWGTPTIQINAKQLGASATSIPLTVKFADGYLTLKDFYCNITVYAYAGTYSDQDFEDQELAEKPNLARWVASANLNERSGYSDTVRGTFELALKEGAQLQEGERLMAKVRLPHTEWEGEEQDFLSASVPVGSATIPLNNTGEGDDPAQPAQPTQPTQPDQPAGAEINVPTVQGSTGISASGVLKGARFLDGPKVELSAHAVAQGSVPSALAQRVGNGTLLGTYEVILRVNDEQLHNDFGSFTLTFPVDAAYNNQTVTILHLHEDGTITEETAVVRGGAVSILVTALSTFSIVGGQSTSEGGSSSDNGNGQVPATTQADLPTTGETGASNTSSETNASNMVRTTSTDAAKAGLPQTGDMPTGALCAGLLCMVATAVGALWYARRKEELSALSRRKH